eukprot:5979520-Amphidinium_carterae.2
MPDVPMQVRLQRSRVEDAFDVFMQRIPGSCSVTDGGQVKPLAGFPSPPPASEVFEIATLRMRRTWLESPFCNSIYAGSDGGMDASVHSAAPDQGSRRPRHLHQPPNACRAGTA